MTEYSRGTREQTNRGVKGWVCDEERSDSVRWTKEAWTRTSRRRTRA